MANTFKVATRASVNHSGADTIYTVPGSTTTVILGMTICNRHSAATDIDVILVSDTAGSNPNTNANVYLMKDVEIPAASTLEVFGGKNCAPDNGLNNRSSCCERLYRHFFEFYGDYLMPYLGTAPASALLETGDIADDAITLAKMASGSANNIIKYDGSGNPSSASGGKVLQVVEGTLTSTFTTTSTSYVGSGLDVAITPASSSNKVLIIASAFIRQDGDGSGTATTIDAELRKRRINSICHSASRWFRQ